MFDEDVLLILGCLKDLGDNPMIAEVCSHIGLRGNKFCPRCEAGGDKEFKQSDPGYHSLFTVSIIYHPYYIYYTINEHMTAIAICYARR